MSRIDVAEPESRQARGWTVGPYPATDALAVAGLLSVALILGRRFSEIGFVGWDAFPILAASGSQSSGWLAHVFSGPLGGGFLPMSFHRPLLALSVALEWPFWGLAAGGYVALNAALLALCGSALYALVLRFGGTRQGALAAVFFFVLHPVVPDVVPYLPRRPELLCTLFVILALWLDHRGRHGFHRPRFGRIYRALIVGSWLATAAAAGAKETAVALPILIACSRWLFPAPGRAAFWQAIRGFAAHAMVLAVALLFRLRALGGLGGYPDTDVTQLPGLWLRTVAKTVLGVFLPSRVEEMIPLIGFGMLVLGFAWMTLRRARRPRRSLDKDAEASRSSVLLACLGPQRVRLSVFAMVWILTLATVYAAAARLSPWYLLIVVGGAAIGFGQVLDFALAALGKGETGRSPAAITLLGAVLLLGSFAVDSPIVRPLEEFEQATRDSEAFLGALEQSLRRAPTGARINVGPYPRLVIGESGRQVPVLVPHSLPGWARIVFPARDIEFVAVGESFAEPVPKDVTVVVLGSGIHKNMAAN